jgi:hypothetical protein
MKTKLCEHNRLPAKNIEDLADIYSHILQMDTLTLPQISRRDTLIL